MNCRIPDSKKILYVFGELNSSEKEEMKIHLNSCEKCSDELKKLRETFEIMDGNLRVDEPSGKCIAGIRELAFEKKRSPLIRWGVPAFAAGLAALILFFSHPILIEETPADFLPTDAEWENIESLVQDEDEQDFSFLCYATIGDEITAIETELAEITEEMDQIGGGKNDEKDISGSRDNASEHSLCMYRSAGRISSRA